MAHTVVGIFDNASDAQKAVDQLVNDGFSRSNIDLSAGMSSDQYVGTSTTQTVGTTDDTKDTNSGVGGFFRSLFGSDDDDNETQKYTTVGDRGSIVTVHTDTDDQAERASDILDDAGAVDVDERAAEYGYVSTTPTLGVYTTAGTGVEGDQTVKVIEENLEVGKRTVETGGVRLRSRVVAKPVEENIRLREERVTVSRTPVNRPATAADLNAFQDGQIELTEHAEVPVVSKTANVVEEITVGKAVSERDEVIRDTVRKTEVDVENLGTTGTTTRTTGTDSDDVTYSTK